uniref:Pxa1p n=2 Tax=Clavispora lusitaniae TaxID=36911 RepID=M9P7Y7_CLALS|nr:Pxa1p [Clavispora lusitaniae]
MNRVSKLKLYKREDIRKLLSLLREFVLVYKDNQVSINYQSRPVILFIGTVVSTFGIGTFFALRSFINWIRDLKDKRSARRPLLIRQSSTILKNGSREIYIPKGKNGTSRIIIPKPNMDRYAADKYLYKNFHIDQKLKSQNNLFNSRFLNQLIIIWRILIPKFASKNTYLLLSQCFFLVLRTWLSLIIAKLDGQIVKNIISANGRKFVRDLIYWILIAFPASYTNAAIKYLTNRLSLGFRTNLTRYIHDMYLDKVMAYYKISLNSNDIQNIDQYITNDVAKFCDSICGLFSSMGKPLIDLVFFSVYLRDNLGTGAIVGIFANYFATAVLLKKFTPSFGKLSSQRTQLEGQYYNEHLNLISNSEEIGFYKGSKIEKAKLRETFNELMGHVSKEINISFSYSIIEDYVLKYTWSAWGYVFACLPVFMEEFFSSETPHQDEGELIEPTPKGNKPVDERQNMRQFIINKRLMLSLADAGSRLMYSIKDVSELTGYTNRVFMLLTNLHVSHSPVFAFGSKYGAADLKGTVQRNYGNGIRFESIPVIIPSTEGSEGVLLIDKLNFQVQERKNLLILGSNGCGKTSIARIMAGLWPIYHGLLSKPSDEEIFYLPQKTYFTNGNLRDQIIYPFSYDDMLGMGYNDDHLYHILREVKLEYLLTREGNFNVKKDWKDVFSGGEKQRMSVARVLFANPKYVVLDEFTNAVSTDIEDYLFELLQSKKITFITLSHRPLLMKYHDYVLEIKGDTSENHEWLFHDLTSEENLKSIDNEISDIQAKLDRVQEWEKRKHDIELYLDGKYDEIPESTNMVMTASFEL